ncbi:MAG TPA: branched-chain amino acid ABC transporter permease [Actinomycetota bacterium]|nr:branched-chain amino acid ABC transporter permease [Actinomycetota bacterium]
MPDCLSHSLLLRVVGGLTTGSIYALIALGYTLVYGVLRLINFAHSEVFMFGTFGGLIPLIWLSHHGNVTNAWYLAIAAIPAMAFAAGIAFLLERLAYRPLRRRGATRLSFLISAIGASLFLQSVVLVWRGRDYETYPDTWKVKQLFTIGNVQISNHDILVFGVMIVMVIALDLLVHRTRIGKGIRAVAQDPETAGLMGVNIDRIITATFIIGGILAGVAGLMYGLRFNTRFDIGFIPGIKAFTAAVLGGIGNIRGALVGGIVLGLLENIGAGCFGDQWKNVIAFGVLVLVLMFRPTGLLGEGVSAQKA